MNLSEADSTPAPDQAMPYSVAEEIANSMSHFVGAALSVLGLYLLLVNASPMDDFWKTLSFSIYGASLIALYMASALYHSFQRPSLKSFFKMADHCAIYLLIAGTYTPFLLVTMNDTIGWTLFAIIWGIALVGIALKVIFKHRYKKLRVATYLAMGWLVVFAGPELANSLAEGGITLLVAGGLTYTLGVVFYVGHRIPFNHAIWHLFVLGGSVLHYLAVFYYVLH